jgi:hypothetical protein
MGIRRWFVIVCISLLVGGTSGCILGNRPTLVQVGSRDDQITFYLDGAGNYGFGKETVPLGLADGGYEGHLQHFIWTTYLGAVVDQISVSHNRREGRQLAEKIQTFLDDHPGGEVNLIGLSAGSGVVVFALETLDPRFHVQNVIMLSSSLSADYDLTAALRRVDGGIYFFWSPDDPILRGVVPILGTVDRSGQRSAPAGTWGARMPFGASKSTRELYSKKVQNIRWYPEPLIGPLKLRHAGSISRSSIRDLVAPILVYRSRFARGPETRPQPTAHAPASPSAGSVSTASTQPSPAGHAAQPSGRDQPALHPAGSPIAASPATRPARRIP